MLHKPVLLTEVISGLALAPGMIVVDGTLGSGGHAKEIAKAIGDTGRLIAMDRDIEAIRRSKDYLKDFRNIDFVHSNYRAMDSELDRLNIQAVDAVILDVGFSSDQVEDSARGFSFEHEGPLDMRMDSRDVARAADFVNDLSQSELENIFREYGEDRRARMFASAICEQRKTRRIETTTQLVETLLSVLPRAFSAPKGRRPEFARRNPAARVFQALRIAVNKELEALEQGLPKAWKRLHIGGRIAVISFHSLEDRIVKNYFRELFRSEQAKLITKKPIVPSRSEVVANTRSRSAKLRIAEKRK